MLVSGSEAHRVRLWVVALIIILALGDLVFRLYTVQVAGGEMYTNRLRDQTTVAIQLSPARGAIVDRNGVALAENRASFDIDLYLDELLRHYRHQHRGKVPRITLDSKKKE